MSIRLGSELLESFGVARSDDVQSAKKDLRETLVKLAKTGDVKGEASVMDKKRKKKYNKGGNPPSKKCFCGCKSKLYNLQKLYNLNCTILTPPLEPANTAVPAGWTPLHYNF